MLLPHNTYLDIIPLKPSFAHLQLLSEPQLNIPKPTLLPPETGSCNLVYKCIRIVQKDLISSYFNTLHLPQLCCVQIRELHNLLSGRGGVVILLDWSGVDLTSNMGLD
jgi:hypothetical protein